ncbi:MAG: hypothetical protein HFF26_01750 [Oscillospiraceae bacterium]|nr:hypothetical protein [Oscillospiraceae bacterium]
MSELEEKLEGILGNPQAMAQIMSLAQSLNLGGPGQGQSQEQDPAPPPEPGPSPARDGAPAPPSGEAPAPAPPAAGSGGLGGLMGALGSLDAGTLSAAAQLMGQFTDGGDDRRTALLNALRPFVQEKRYAKLDKAIQIAKLSRLIRSGLTLFRARREDDGHV